MKVCIIQDNGLNESLALVEAVAYLRQRGHQFALFLESEERGGLEGRIREFAPDALLVPSDVGAHHWFHRMTAWLKQRFPLPLISGGIYPTFFTEEAFADPHVDYLVIGEAELPLADLLAGLEAGADVSRQAAVWGRAGGREFRNSTIRPIRDLDELPLPDRALYFHYPFIRDFSVKRFNTGRGCTNQCTYCFNPRYKTMFAAGMPYVRRKSVGKVIEEILDLQRLAPMRSIHFSDDIFITSKAWIEEFAEQYPRRVGIPFSCNCMVDHLSEPIIDCLARAGCRAIALGIESGDETIRREILRKYFTNADAIAAARRLREKGVLPFSFNMFALPGETPDDALKTVDLNLAMGTYHGRSNMTLVLPKTELARLARERGLLRDEEAEYVRTMPDFRDSREFTAVAPEMDFRNILNLFPLVLALPRQAPRIKKWMRGKYRRIYKLFLWLALFRERKFFAPEWISAFRYYRHTGNPYQRTKNFASLI